MLQKIGIQEEKGQNKKLSLKPQKLNDDGSSLSVPYHSSQHTMALQRSNYLVIDSSLKNLLSMNGSQQSTTKRKQGQDEDEQAVKNELKNFDWFVAVDDGFIPCLG